MRYWVNVLGAGLVILAGAGPAAAQVGYDRRGSDYSSFAVRNGDPAVCASRCEHDGRCRAWSFSYPRTTNVLAACRLKNRVPPRAEDACCVSGVRGAGVIEPRRGRHRIFHRPLRRRLSQLRSRDRRGRGGMQVGLRGRRPLPRLHLCAARLYRRLGALLSQEQADAPAPQAVLHFGRGEIIRHGRACPRPSTRLSIYLKQGVDARPIGVRSTPSLRTAMAGHDAG